LSQKFWLCLPLIIYKEPFTFIQLEFSHVALHSSLNIFSWNSNSQIKMIKKIFLNQSVCGFLLKKWNILSIFWT
jgi:hypothetical protein